jgi:crotonobetainyl-CoA:carnitine CoA-transferase CaiB-like acyl-CoA transferase
MTELTHIFDGIRVLDFTEMAAGPTITRLMAEAGAEIIKVEPPPKGDATRSLPYMRDGRSGYFIQQNRGKKSLCLDLKTSKGRAVLMDLLPSVDVVVESFTPGTIGRLGFDYETVRSVNSRIVMCSLSAFGQEGPLANQPGFDHIAQAYAGVTSMVGEPDSKPTLTSVAIGDVMTGMLGLAAVSAALFHRERTGRGQHTHVSLLDAYFNCHEINVQAYSGSRGEIRPTRSGSHHFAVCPYGIFQANGGYVFIGVPSDHLWPRLCKAIGKPELTSDPRYCTNQARTESREEVIALIEEFLATLSSVEEAVRILESERVPVAPILTVDECISHPYLRERRTVRTVTDRVWGEIDLPGMPMRFSEFPEELQLEAAFLGEHNEDILQGYLGYGADDCRRLADERVLTAEEPSGVTPSHISTRSVEHEDPP